MTWAAPTEAATRMAATTAGASFSVTTNVAIPAFSLVVACFASDAAGTGAYPALPASGADYTWQMANRTQSGTGGMSATYWAYCPTGIPSGTTISTTSPNSPTNRQMALLYATGGSRWSGFLDGSNALNFTAAGAGQTMSMSPTRSNGLWVSCVTGFGATGDTATPTASWTQLGVAAFTGTFSMALIYRNSGLTAGTSTAGVTWSTSQTKGNSSGGVFFDNIMDVVTLERQQGMLVAVGTALR